VDLKEVGYGNWNWMEQADDCAVFDINAVEPSSSATTVLVRLFNLLIIVATNLPQILLIIKGKFKVVPVLKLLSTTP
jgi:hypothetical protein